jgi:DNA-binding transcriptional LysR family regulator
VDEQLITFAIAPCLSTDSVYVARNTALAGLGAAIVSSWAVAEDIAAGRLVELFPQWRASPLPVHLVYPWARYYPTRLRKFLDLMREVMPQIAGCSVRKGNKKDRPRGRSCRGDVTRRAADG